MLTYCKLFAIVWPPVNALPSPTTRGSARSGIGLLLLLLFLGMETLALFPHVHHALHADFSAGDHVCAVTLLESGCLESGGAGAQVAGISTAPLELFSEGEFSPFVPNPGQPGLPERGPPHLAASHTVPA